VDALAAPAGVAAAVLVAAGAIKLKKPLPVTGALALVKLPRSTRLAKALGTIEIAIGVAALLGDPRETYSVLAAAYVFFAAFTAWAIYTDQPLASCGCFGDPDTPAMPSHLLLTVIAAAVAASAAAGGSPALRTLLTTYGWNVLPLTLFFAVAIYLAYLAFAVLPHTAGRPSRGGEEGLVRDIP